MPRLILASQSSARRRLLKRLLLPVGVPFQTRPAHIDEDAVARIIREPTALVRELAQQKARSVGARFADAVVIGSDQLVVFDRRIYGKPHTEARACAQLQKFSAQTIEILTAVCVREPSGKESRFVQRTQMQFRPLSSAEIRAYVKLDQPLDCAGSFKFESCGIGLFSRVRTDDPSSIEGLPLLRLAAVLNKIGLLYIR